MSYLRTLTWYGLGSNHPHGSLSEWHHPSITCLGGLALCVPSLSHAVWGIPSMPNFVALDGMDEFHSAQLRGLQRQVSLDRRGYFPLGHLDVFAVSLRISGDHLGQLATGRAATWARRWELQTFRTRHSGKPKAWRCGRTLPKPISPYWSLLGCECMNVSFHNVLGNLSWGIGK